MSNVFCNHAAIYIYHEGQSNKAPDEVCSSLNNYFSSVPSKSDNYTYFHICVNLK